MLTSLQVKNFAIIDQIEVEFGGGMTVLTGETGAGKSILVDALGLVLGERGGGSLVRRGTKRAEISAVFDVAASPHAATWLEENALDSDGECLLRRVINADGRSRAFINGNAVPLQSLKSLGELLLDIHGQHFHQSLGRPTVQRDLLDHFASALALRLATETAFKDWRNLATELEALEAADADRASRLDLLTFQTNELLALDVQPDETTELLSNRRKLQNSGRLAEGVATILETIYESDSGNAQSLVADACQTLESLSELDEQLAPVLTLLKEANIQISEAADSLRRYSDTLDMDPAERDRVEDRLDAIQTLARKHRVDVNDLQALQERLQKQLHDIQHAEERGVELQEQTKAAEGQYKKAAMKLSKARHKAAAEFSDLVTSTMTDLGMSGGVFEVSVSNHTKEEPQASGIDNIEFLISANPGQPPMPLSKVASGGELSRMSLSIQVIASDGSPIPTMVFDEIDSGVGGGIAEMVGKRLRDVSATRQVFCVTHLPQVASIANNHFRIVKMTDGKSTRTSVNALTDDERIEELARMLGGIEITDRTRDHAAEMLEFGGNYESGKPTISKSA
jgi:DNA repair protein RecN (Recombination protein N)